MKIVENMAIKDKTSLVFAKTTLRNYMRFNEKVLDESFLLLSLMELATNLLKHANGGFLWILESETDVFLAALDYGAGIKDLEWAKKKGTTRMQNSLGLGLFQMENNGNYTIEIVSLTLQELHGTIVLVRPRRAESRLVFLQENYPGEMVSGDLFAKKGRFLLLGDVSGHGRKAKKSADAIKSYFYDTPISCVVVDEFFECLDQKLKQEALRGVVLSLVEVNKKQAYVCGVGNISLWHKSAQEYKYYAQKDGILGEVYRKHDTREFSLKKGELLILATDGIDVGAMNMLCKNLDEVSPDMLAVSALHFASVAYDDVSVVIIKGEE